MQRWFSPFAKGTEHWAIGAFVTSNPWGCHAAFIAGLPDDGEQEANECHRGGREKHVMGGHTAQKIAHAVCERVGGPCKHEGAAGALLPGGPFDSALVLRPRAGVCQATARRPTWPHRRRGQRVAIPRSAVAWQAPLERTQHLSSAMLFLKYPARLTLR